MLSEVLFPDTPVLIQGITGRTGRRHASLMRAYGTRVVGGVSPSRAEAGTGDVEDGIPIFATCREAVRRTGAVASLQMVPPLNAMAAVEEALDAGVRLIVTTAEGMPAHDALKAARMVRGRGATWIGPSSPGVAIPGRMKIGFLPDVSLTPGPLGVMSKSGTLSYELCHRLGRRGIGQSAWVGVGGDAVKGTRFADLVPFFQADASTKALLVIGEIGGDEEEGLADALARHAFPKPVFVLLAGSTAPEGVTMGHAGAMVYGSKGSVRSKTEALGAVGARVFVTMRELVEGVAREFDRPPPSSRTC